MCALCQNRYATLVYAFGKNDQWQLAYDTLDMMAGDGEGLEPDILVFHQVMRACQKAQQ